MKTIQQEIWEYSMNSRQNQKEETAKKQNQGVRQATNKLMNTQTDNTGPFGANTNPFQTSMYKTTKDQMERNSRIVQLNKHSETMFNNMTNEDQIEMLKQFTGIKSKR